jgi:hypothetical protein
MWNINEEGRNDRSVEKQGTLHARLGGSADCLCKHVVFDFPSGSQFRPKTHSPQRIARDTRAMEYSCETFASVGIVSFVLGMFSGLLLLSEDETPECVR